MRLSARRLSTQHHPARLEPSRASYRCFTIVATNIFRGVKSVGDWRGALDSSFLDHHASKKNAAWPLRTPRPRLLDQWGPVALKLRPDLIERVERRLCFRFYVWPWQFMAKMDAKAVRESLQTGKR